MPTRDCDVVRFQRTIAAPYEKSKSLGSGGSMVARLKLKGIDGRTHQRWSLRFNLTQHGETYQVQTWWGLTVWKHFLDSMGGGAWPFLVGGVICLVDSDNERDGESLLVRHVTHVTLGLLYSTTWFYQGEAPRNNRSVMPLDVLGYTRATMTSSTSFFSLPGRVWVIFSMLVVMGLDSCNY